MSAREPVWSNWSGFVEAHPRSFATPKSEDELIALLRRDESEPVRVVGSGHSFTEICPSEGLMLDLSELSGVVSIDQERHRATVLAGSKIWQLGEPLLEAGLAMTNMGDIDRQAIAGAVSTGTHGTGRDFGSISSQVVGVRLITAAGEILDIDESEPDLLAAAQVSIGALGVITRLTLQLVPAFKLHERNWHEPLETCLEQLDEQIERHRHFEFFYSPLHRRCAMKSLDVTDGEPFTGDDFDPDRMLGERAGWSSRIFPSERNRKFNETEFALPEGNGPACLRELVTMVHRDFPDMKWPFEYRRVKPDEAWLSPFFDRESVTIAAHEGAELPFEDYFAAVQAIFRQYDGRPHWGKRHDHTPAELERLYPRWGDFHALRRELDPGGRFLNRHLRSTFGS